MAGPGRVLLCEPPLWLWTVATTAPQIAACDARLDVRLDDHLDAKVAAKIRHWRSVLAGNVAATRVLLLKKLLVGDIIMTALPGKTGYRFDGKIKLDELLALGGAVTVASPTGTVTSWFT